VRIAILGPLDVSGSDGPVEIGGARLRTLLVRLALDAGRVVPTDALVDAVWGDEPPAAAGNALQALVSRLRRVLPEPARLVASPAGYRLDADAVDAEEFERLAAAGHAALVGGDPARAAALLGEALALWRGPALVEVADAGFARASALRLEERRLAAVEDGVEAEVYAAIALAEHDAGTAARLLGYAEAVRGVANRGSRELDATVAAVRDALGPETYTREYTSTAAYSLTEAREAVRLCAGTP
jgi:DNA-binding SARP family transcriptional activator